MLTLADILNKLESHLGPEAASLHLAASLETLGLPVRLHYTPEEVMAIAAEVVRSQQSILKAAESAEVQALQALLEPLIDSFAQPTKNNQSSP